MWGGPEGQRSEKNRVAGMKKLFMGLLQGFLRGNKIRKISNSQVGT
jgi:hypothetical protein